MPAKIKCEFCNNEIIGVIKFANHLREEHLEEFNKQNRERNNALNQILDAANFIEEKEYIN